MELEYQTKYHKKGLEEQRKAKEEFVLKYYSDMEWGRSIQNAKFKNQNLIKNSKLKIKNENKIQNANLKSQNGVKNSKLTGNNTQSESKRLIKKTLYYHFPDHLDSSNLVMDEAGNVVEISDYFPYGEVRVSQSFDNSFSTRKQFTGKEQDLTGLYYFGARYYDPRVGEVDERGSGFTIFRKN